MFSLKSKHRAGSSLYGILGLMVAVFVLVSCERIPEGERRALLKSDQSDEQLVQSLKRWVFVCRVKDMHAQDDQSSMGARLSDMVELFQSRGLSSLKDLELPQSAAVALWWKDEGELLVSANFLRWGHDYECSNGSEWLPAQKVAHDRALDLAVLQLMGGESLASLKSHWKKQRWSLREADLSFREKLFWVSALTPDRLELMTVTAHAAPLEWGTGIDEGLWTFLPVPRVLDLSGLLVDEKFSVLGFCPSQKSELAGICYRSSFLRARLGDLLAKGDLPIASLGFRLGFLRGVGFRISEIEVNGPAYRAGLRVGDRLVSLNGRVLKVLSDWAEPSARQIGQSIPVTYERSAKTFESEVMVGDFK